jgi:hypothetical protein
MSYEDIPVLFYADILWLPKNRKKKRRIINPPNITFVRPSRFSRPELRNHLFDAVVIYSEVKESDGNYRAKISILNAPEDIIKDLKKNGVRERNSFTLWWLCHSNLSQS